jgi:hypothetical protein
MDGDEIGGAAGVETSGIGAPAAPGRPVRMTAGRKRDAVLRLLRGDALVSGEAAPAVELVRDRKSRRVGWIAATQDPGGGGGELALGPEPRVEVEVDRNGDGGHMMSRSGRSSSITARFRRSAIRSCAVGAARRSTVDRRGIRTLLVG